MIRYEVNVEYRDSVHRAVPARHSTGIWTKWADSKKLEDENAALKKRIHFLATENAQLKDRIAYQVSFPVPL